MHSVSGEPRFAADGAFDGYWGVARDVTEEMRAQRAFAASETRYRELFERSPSPLFLHRRGIVFDANPAAARLFGFDERGGDERHCGSPTCSRRANRASASSHASQQLESMPSAKACRCSDFQARSRRRPADQRAGDRRARRFRRRPGDAVDPVRHHRAPGRRGGAAPLGGDASHLFATSPDCITLSEMKSGRHTMVNAAFTRADRLTRPTRWSAAPRPSSASGTTCAIATACAPRWSATAASTTCRRRSQQRSGRHRVGAGLGRALRDGRPRLHGRQRARRHRHRADPPRACGDPRARIDRHRLHARAPLRAGQSALGIDLRLGAPAR